MLSRTASDLYWMSRYLERAENLARMLDVSYSLSLLPQDRNGGGLDELAMPLLITGTLDAYLERHGELAAERLLSFRPRPGQPGEHLQLPGRCACQCPCGTRADHPGHVGEHQRHLAGNARHRRRGHPALWHQSLLRMGEGPLAPVPRRDLRHQHAQRCVPLHPSRNLHRTRRQYLAPARCALPDPGRGGARRADEGTARGYYQWSALLRALSAFEGYTELYRASPNARNIAELLLLREDVPRSLLSCIEELSEILSGLPGVNGRPAQRLAAELEARVRYTGIDEVLEQGLHTWITDYILLVRQLANAIHSSYLEAA